MLWNQRLALRIRFGEVLLVDHCRACHLDSTQTLLVAFISMNSSHSRLFAYSDSYPIITLFSTQNNLFTCSAEENISWSILQSFSCDIAYGPSFHWLTPILMVKLIVWRHEMLLAQVEWREARVRRSTNTSFWKSTKISFPFSVHNSPSVELRNHVTDPSPFHQLGTLLRIQFFFFHFLSSSLEQGATKLPWSHSVENPISIRPWLGDEAPKYVWTLCTVLRPETLFF